jgi:hypothetical protein
VLVFAAKARETDQHLGAFLGHWLLAIGFWPLAFGP